MKTLFILAALLAAPAFAGNYVLTCSTPCVASDGTTASGDVIDFGCMGD